MSMDTESDPPNYTVEELTRLIEDLKHEEPEVIFYIIFFPFPASFIFGSLLFKL